MRARHSRPRPRALPASTYPEFLPREAHAVLSAIARGGPYEYRQDGGVFQNRERLLPSQPRGYYREFTVETPGSRDRGARRLITGGDPPRRVFLHRRPLPQLPPLRAARRGGAMTAVALQALLADASQSGAFFVADGDTVAMAQAGAALEYEVVHIDLRGCWTRTKRWRGSRARWRSRAGSVATGTRSPIRCATCRGCRPAATCC